MTKEVLIQPSEAVRAEAARGATPDSGGSAVYYLEPLGAPGEGQSDDLMEYLVLFRRHLVLIVLLTVLCTAAMLGYALWQVPIFEARSTLEIQTIPDSGSHVRFGDTDTSDGGPTFTPESYLQTQVRILQSKSLRSKVLRKLQERPGEWDRNPHRQFVGWCRMAGINCEVIPTATASSRPEPDVKVRALDNTRIIEITCDSSHPALSAECANTMVREYIEENLSSRWTAAQRTREWLTRQLEDLKNKLQKSETQLRSYERRSGIVLTTDKREAGQDHLMKLQDEFAKAQADRISKQASYEIAKAVPVESLADVIDNPQLGGYQSKLTDLRRELAELSSELTPEHYKVQRVEAQIQEMQSALKRERENIVGRIRNDFKAAESREALLFNAYQKQRGAVTQMSQSLVDHEMVQREVDSMRRLYDELVRRVNEAAIVSAARASSIRVLDTAEPPRGPMKPTPLRNALMGGVVGLFAGLSFVAGRDLVNRTLKAPGDVAHHLGLVELGTIPERNCTRQPALVVATDSPIKLLDSGGGNGTNLALSAWQDRVSPLAESYRSAVASILTAGPQERARVLMVTSPARGDGKSTMTGNLAVALAEILPRVLMIDADMRNPRLHAIFDVPNNWGLSDLLREKSAFEEIPRESLARKTEIPGLYLLPSGPAIANLSSLLYSQRIPGLVERLRKDFDLVLIDTPPLLQLADARVLGRWADAAILVVRAGKTQPGAALVAKQMLKDCGIRILGAVLNRWDVRHSTRYGYSYYDYQRPA